MNFFKKKIFRKIVIYAILFLLPLYVFPVWWCSSDAETWYEGDIELQDQLAESMKKWIEGSLDRGNFSTGSDQFDGEWLFGTYMMSGMGFGQMALEHPKEKEKYIRSMEVCIRKLLAEETKAFDLEFWSNDPIDSIGSEYDHCSFLGYLNLLLSLHRKLKPDSEFAELNDKITEHLLNRLKKTPIRLLQSYPGEVFPVDNCAVFGSIGLHAEATGKKCDKILAESFNVFEKRYVDKKTGLLIQYVNPATGDREDHPRGSGTALGVYMLSFANPQLAKKLYQGIKKELASSCLRFGGVKEYPAGIKDGSGDIDSGPVIFGYSTSATGFGISGARIYRDKEFYSKLCATLYLIGAPHKSEGKLHFLTGGPLGNAIMFAMLTAPKEPQ